MDRKMTRAELVSALIARQASRKAQRRKDHVVQFNYKVTRDERIFRYWRNNGRKKGR